MSVFKSYLRRLHQDLKDLKEALKNGEYEKAEKFTDKLIEDTQKGLEDQESKKERESAKPPSNYFIAQSLKNDYTRIFWTFSITWTSKAF